MTVVSYKCPNCGAELEFDPKTQKFGCEYCSSQFTKEELDRIRPEPEAADQPEDKKEAEKTVRKRLWSTPARVAVRRL